MALDVWVKDDVRALIVALTVTVVSTADADGGHNVEYCRGALAMARSMALAHKCTWSDVLGDVRAAVGADLVAVALLEA